MVFYTIPEILKDEINDFKISIDDFNNGKISPVEFRAIRVPFGIYEQRKDNTYMVRIRCTAGGITPVQFKKVAGLSKSFGSGKIHVTTRQEVQIHDVLLDDIITVLNELLSVGLATRGGGGNTVRNIIANKDSGIDSGEVFDVEPYAISLSSQLISESGSWGLPRKFKIGFFNKDDNITGALIHDLGFVAVIKDGQYGFKVYVAGGLGARSRSGHLLHEFIPVSSIYSVTSAVKLLFDNKGNRKNKHSARLRFLWEKLGREKFIELYESELDNFNKTNSVELEFNEIENTGIFPGIEKIKFENSDYKIWTKRFVTEQKQEGLFKINIPLKLGDISHENTQKLSALLEYFGENTIRFTVNQNITLRNIPGDYLGNLYKVIQGISEFTQNAQLFGNIVACAGANTCKLGLCLSRGAATAIYNRLINEDINLDELEDLNINISGCPNSCGKHQVADLGFSGKVGRKDGHVYPAYRLFAGTAVKNGELQFAHKLADISARDLPDAVVDILKTYLTKKDNYKSFSDYINNEGKNDIASISKKYEDIPDFGEDKNYYYDWGSNDIFSVTKLGQGECSASLFDLIDIDVEEIKKNREIAENNDGDTQIQEALYNIIFSSSRMLLVTKGIATKNDNDVFEQFEKGFIKENLISDEYLEVIEPAKLKNIDKLIPHKNKIFRLSEAVLKLYDSMDNSLRFPSEQNISRNNSNEVIEKSITKTKNADVFKDYRGVKCPMNFVKSKLDLEMMSTGETLEILLDDGEPIENVPASIKSEGHKILSQKNIDNYWSVVVEKR